MSFMNGSPFLAYRPGLAVPTLKVSQKIYKLQELIEAVRIAKAKGLIRDPDPAPPLKVVPKNSGRKVTLFNLICTECKAPFQGMKHAKFCSKKCNGAAYKREQKLKASAERNKRRRTPICGMCNERFVTFRVQSVYCEKCRALPNFGTLFHRISKKRCNERLKTK